MQTPEAKHADLVIPALRAYMGDWTYYISFLTLRQVADHVRTAQEIWKSKSLNQLIQRRLTDRADSIADYLTKQPQRLFNALVVGAYKGSAEWREVSVDFSQFLNAPVVPVPLEATLGLLSFSSIKNLFAIDGQHRVVGIRQALQLNPSLGDEQVCIIFVGHDVAGPEGVERTRRLFTTLNRYAKAVNAMDKIALDEDDVVAIVTRRLVESHALFRDKVAITGTKSINPRDKQSFTTIVALYDALDILLADRPRQWGRFKRFRPEEGMVQQYYDEALLFWNAMASSFDALTRLKESTHATDVIKTHRNPDGGNILFRPIGLLMIVNTIRHLRNQGIALEDAIRAVAKVPQTLREDPWSGLLWDATNRRMITAPENQKVARRLLFYSVGGDLSRLKTSADALTTEWAGLVNKEPDEMKLPRYV